jgi:tetratricopeptide (TPR) repeat protein
VTLALSLLRGSLVAKVYLNIGGLLATKALVQLELELDTGDRYLEMAECYLIRATAVDPANDAVRLILARVYAGQAEYDKAIQEIEMVTTNYLPGDDRLRIEGDFYWLAGERDKAANVWKQIPEPVDYLLNQCYSYREAFQLDVAERYCLGAVTIAPGHGWARYFLSRVYRDKGELELAEKEIRVVIQSYPETLYYLFLGDLLVEMNRLEEAVAVYELILTLDVDNAEAKQRLEELLE